MSIITVLIWSPVLAFLYLMAQSTAYRLQHGIKTALSSRDEEQKPNVLTGRATRAFRNFQETYPIFIALAVCCLYAGETSAMANWGATLWFWARVAYLPAYLMGLSPYRSIIWSLSGLGLLLIFIAIAF